MVEPVHFQRLRGFGLEVTLVTLITSDIGMRQFVSPNVPLLLCFVTAIAADHICVMIIYVFPQRHWTLRFKMTRGAFLRLPLMHNFHMLPQFSKTMRHKIASGALFRHVH